MPGTNPAYIERDSEFQNRFRSSHGMPFSTISNMKSNDPYFYVGGQRCTSRCKMAHMHTRRPTNMYRERERERERERAQKETRAYEKS